MKKTLQTLALGGLLLGMTSCEQEVLTEGKVKATKYEPLNKSYVLTVDGTNNKTYILSIKEDSVPVDGLAEFIKTDDKISFPVTDFAGNSCFNEQGIGRVSSDRIKKLNLNLEDTSTTRQRTNQ